MNEVTRIEHEPVSPMVSMIERVALDPAMSIEKLERLLDMQERIQNASARAEYNSAFAAASAKFPSIPLNGRGDKSKPYALLKDIISGTKPVLAQFGLALTFSVDSSGDRVRCTAKLVHVSGHSEETTIELPKDQSGSKNAVQAVGSSQTYGQRYAAQAILGLSLGDDTEDDGKAAGGGNISAEEFIQIRDLIEQTGTDEAKFCAFLKIENVEEMPKAKFAGAISALRNKKRQAAQ